MAGGAAGTGSVGRVAVAARWCPAPVMACGSRLLTGPIPSPCSTPRTPRGFPPSCPCAGAGCSSPRSPSCAARRASWPPTWPIRRPRACRSSCAGTPTWRAFGVFASPRRRLLFHGRQRLRPRDHPAARGSGTSAPGARAPWSSAVWRALRSPGPGGRGPRRWPSPTHEKRLAGLGELDVWYERVDAKAALRIVGRSAPAPLRSAIAGAHHQTSPPPLAKLTVRTDGRDAGTSPTIHPS